MKNQRIDDDYINDILTAIKLIEDYTSNLDFEDFKRNNMCFQAVLLNIAIIGESANKISKERQQEYPEIPFPAIISMRNRLIHGYFEVDSYRVWLVVKDDIPVLKTKIKKMLSDLQE